MSDRFHVLDKGRLPSPAKCWCCGATDRDCIDWGADIGFVGAILLCVVCVGEAASLLTSPVDEEKEALKAQLKAQEKALEGLQNELVASIDRVFIATDRSIVRTVTEFAGSSNLSPGAIPKFKK